MTALLQKILGRLIFTPNLSSWIYGDLIKEYIINLDFKMA